MSSEEPAASADRPLTIAQIVPRYAPAIGGVERQAEAICRGLAQRGFRVEVVTTDPTGQLPAVEVRDGVLVRRFPTVANDDVYYISPRLAGWLRRNAGRFDLFHAHSYHTPIALQAALLARGRGIPFVLTPCYHGGGHSPLRSALHVPYRAFGAWLVRGSGRVICISSAERQLLARHFGLNGSGRVIPSGIDVAEVQAAVAQPKPAGRRLMLAVCRLESYKRMDLLVDALPLLPDDVDLLIVGQGPAKDDLERRIARHRLGDRARFAANLGRAELLGWYRAADVFATLSEHESFGLCLLEAAAGGCALVASDIPAHRDVASLSGGAHLTFARQGATPAEVAAAVQQALAAGRHQPDPNSLPTWDRHVDQLNACYRELLPAGASA